MKSLLLLLLLSCLLFSCEKEVCTEDKNPIDVSSNNPLVGEWHLVETYNSPGGGPVNFQPIVSNKIITFFANGRVSSNEDLCIMNAHPNQPVTPSTGTYSNGVINTNCNVNFPWDITYQRTGNTLIISYPCTCPCQAKYIKL